MIDFEYERRKRLGLAKLLGINIKIHESDFGEWACYDGKTLHISEKYKPVDIDHEIGHFLAATPKERRKIEWNLGMGPSFPPEDIIVANKIGIPTDYRCNSDDKGDYPADQEAKASIYGIAVTFVWGANHAWREHAESHTWNHAQTACDVPCLLRASEHSKLEPSVKRLITRLNRLTK